MDPNPDPRIRTSDELFRMRVREAQKHTDPGPEHWYMYGISFFKAVLQIRNKSFGTGFIKQ
jgi:hypothetical protein